MSCVQALIATTAIDLTAESAETVPAKSYGWCARIVGDVMLHVAVADENDPPTATDDDYPVLEFAEALIVVPAHAEISIVSEENGTVWVSEIKRAY